MTKKKEPKIFTLDTETIGLEGDLKRIALYDGERIYYGFNFTDIEFILIDSFNNGFMPHIYIHNADFDLRKIPEVFEIGNVVWARTKKIGSKFARIVCKNYIIHDSFKLLPFSLAKLSKDFGLQHSKLDLWEAVQKFYPDKYKDHIDFLNRCNKNNPLYLEYLGYDVVSLYELIEKLIDVSGIPADKFISCISTASMSKYVFKNGYKGQVFGTGEKTDYEILSTNKAWGSNKKMKFSDVSYAECELKIRQAFYGGRTEVFTPILNETAYHYDVNSLYPSVMKGKEYPIGYADYENDPFIISKNWQKWTEDHKGLGFIRAKIFIPDQYLPPLPAKLGKLAFVNGYVVGSWTYNELEFAINKCNVIIIDFIEQIHFKNTYPIFDNFVKCFYKLKVQGKTENNPSLTAFAKLMLNTGYGWTVLRRDDKTAFRDIKHYAKYKDSEKFIIANEKYGYIEIFDNVYSDSIQVQIGAYVTSYARLVLLEALKEQSEKGKIYYCDTDSIVCSEPLADDLISSTELGKWDLEGVLSGGLFLQPKVYTEEKEGEKPTIKFKGISKARQKQLTKKDYENILHLLQTGEQDKILIEKGRSSLPSLSVAMKKNSDPNKLNIIDKSINLRNKQKRDIDFINNKSKAWFMSSFEAFESFNFSNLNDPNSNINIL